MITVKEARGRAGSRLKRKMAAWATGEADVPAFNLGLRPPPESKMLEDPGAVDDWVRGWKSVAPPLEVEYVERRWRTLGAQVLPNRLIVGSPDDLAGFVGAPRPATGGLFATAQPHSRRFWGRARTCGKSSVLEASVYWTCLKPTSWRFSLSWNG